MTPEPRKKTTPARQSAKSELERVAAKQMISGKAVRARPATGEAPPLKDAPPLTKKELEARAKKELEAREQEKAAVEHQIVNGPMLKMDVAAFTRPPKPIDPATDPGRVAFRYDPEFVADLDWVVRLNGDVVDDGDQGRADPESSGENGAPNDYLDYR